MGYPCYPFTHVLAQANLNSSVCKSLAERGGFEPPKPFWSLHAFQACLFNHSSISPSSLCLTFRLFSKNIVLAFTRYMHTHFGTIHLTTRKGTKKNSYMHYVLRFFCYFSQFYAKKCFCIGSCLLYNIFY